VGQARAVADVQAFRQGIDQATGIVPARVVGAMSGASIACIGVFISTFAVKIGLSSGGRTGSAADSTPRF
jgi:hypothetical protein